MRTLSEHGLCSEFLADFLDLIKDKLIRVDHQSRASTAELLGAFQHMEARGRDDEGYWTRARSTSAHSEIDLSFFTTPTPIMVPQKTGGVVERTDSTLQPMSSDKLIVNATGAVGLSSKARSSEALERASPTSIGLGSNIRLSVTSPSPCSNMEADSQTPGLRTAEPEISMPSIGGERRTLNQEEPEISQAQFRQPQDGPNPAVDDQRSPHRRKSRIRFLTHLRAWGLERVGVLRAYISGQA